MSSPFRVTPDGVVLHLRVTPNAGMDRIEGIEPRDDGTAVLRLRVRAVPDKGKANAAVLAVLAKALGVPKSALAITAGGTARLKTVRILGDGAQLQDRLKTLIPTGPDAAQGD